MRNISDIIEEHLKEIFRKNKTPSIEIQRTELAGQFRCVPSQINYVISTRFTFEKGYHVESKRGGGGYIRIQKMELPKNKNLYLTILQMIGNEISQTKAEHIISRLKEERVISSRESHIMRAGILREVLTFELPIRDRLRANILKNMIAQLSLD